MSDQSEIIALAAKGDGITSDGKHVKRTVPGDQVSSGGAVTRGPHHIDPACRHFDRCGGCQLQHADDTVLAQFVRGRVVNAAKGQGVSIGEVLSEHLSPAHARRRATLHAMRTKGGAVLGYKEAGSHHIVDLSQCPVLVPELTKLISPLRRLIAKFGPRANVDIAFSLCDQGVDLGLSNFPLEGLEPTEAVLDFAREQALARLSIDQGFGPETVWEPEPVTITLSGHAVGMPPGTFLQATDDGQERLVADAASWLGEARLVADLFSGLGTFAFALSAAGTTGGKVLAVEADQAAHLACKSAASLTGGRVLAMHRDLFRNPLTRAELSRFDAVLLDPPRAGARSQIEQIAESMLERCVYVSCNPSSWARDAAVLSEKGFNLAKVRPVGQFRWSNHVELVSLFER